jgi:hypothetical protein
MNAPMHAYRTRTPARPPRLADRHLLLLSLVIGFCITFGGGWALAGQTDASGGRAELPEGLMATRRPHDAGLMAVMEGRRAHDTRAHRSSLETHPSYLCIARPRDATDAAGAAGAVWSCEAAPDDS